MPKMKIRNGDCVSSVAARSGVFWEKIWNHPDNAKLKEDRKDPNILYRGDELFVPDKEEKEESGDTEQRHSFQKKGTPVYLRLQISRNTAPVENAEYILKIGNIIHRGKTDNEGWIEEHPIPPEFRRGELTFTNKGLEFDLLLGSLDPIDTVEGVKERLANLGFDPGPVDGKLRPQMEIALSLFQEIYGIEVSGELDQETKDKLKEIHGS